MGAGGEGILVIQAVRQQNKRQLVGEREEEIALVVK